MKAHLVCLLGLLALLGTSCQQGASPVQVRQPRGDPLPLDAALEDMDFFFKTVEQVHPNHLADMSSKDYKSLQRRCREALRAQDQRHGREQIP